VEGLMMPSDLAFSLVGIVELLPRLPDL